MLDLTEYVETLRHVTRTDPDPRVRHRADALLLLAHGRRVEEVADDSGCCTKRIRVWRRRFLADGRDGLADRPRSGRPPALDAAARDLLERALAATPLDYGYPVTTWTLADLADLLGRHGWGVCTTTVARTLRTLGYRYRRPRHDLTHRQDHEAVASAQHALRELQKRGLAGAGFRLISVDECDVHTHPHLAKVWQRRGQPLRVPAAGEDERVAVYGALDYASGRVLSQTAASKNGAGFAAFLEQVAQTWPEQTLVLVLDNASYHRSAAMRTWWAAQDGRLIPFWLPKYAPHLNLQERVWRFLKQKLACHRFWADPAGLAQAAGTLLRCTEARFHTPDRPAIRLGHDFCASA
jgi:transposase